MKIPSRVVIVGGTHGNEWTGIHIVRHYQEYLRNKFPNLSLEFILANPVAYQMGSRFKDEDLNRAFQFLNETRNSYEHTRAHEIKEIIQREPCLVLDLHTTTSNMGNTVIVPQYNPLNLSLCTKLTENIKDCRVIGSPDPKLKFVASQSEFGLILEIGPVANGVVAGVPLESTLLLIECILAELSGLDQVKKGSLELYEESQDVRYPKNEKGELNGYIHSEFQGKDFLLISGKFIPFKTFQNEEIEMETDENLFPIFINEAAYYPQDLAFTLCRKKILNF
jgi:succinylglutamate desuccinylase